MTPGFSLDNVICGNFTNQRLPIPGIRSLSSFFHGGGAAGPSYDQGTRLASEARKRSLSAVQAQAGKPLSSPGAFWKESPPHLEAGTPLGCGV